MKIECGTYKHFKGKRYTVYGTAHDHQNNEYVLYQQRYADKAFWIRPISMFTEEVEHNGQKVPRFSLLNAISEDSAFDNFLSILRQKSISILNSETENVFKIFSVNTTSKKIVLMPYDAFSAYLTDTQIAWRMGYDFFKIDEEKFIHSTSLQTPPDKQLDIDDGDSVDKVYKDKEIIKNLNPCSIDLHVSDHFFSKSKRKTIDIASMMHFSVKASELWKEIHLKNINGFDGIALRPGQAIITHTLEKITLPSDCAGKIEIKSTYARLALTVTASDFCNPGWKGYFPLVITNNSNHTIVLHPKEKMLQLCLVPTDGSIINEYSQNATYMNDDGTPYKFWHAQTIKHLQKERYSDEILVFYQKVQSSINPDNSENPDETKKRFEDSFLLFCEKKLKSEKYTSIRNPKTLLKKLWGEYRRKEARHKFLMSKLFKVLAFIGTFIPSIIVACIELLVNQKLDWTVIIWFGGSMVASIILEIIFRFLTPNCFCTFEKLEFETIYKMKNP